MNQSSDFDRKLEAEDCVTDISPDTIMKRNEAGNAEMLVFPKLTENAIEVLAKEYDIPDNAEELTLTAKISENHEVSAEFQFYSGDEEQTVPIAVSQKFSDAVIEATESHLEVCGTSIQHEFAEYAKEENQFVKG